MADRFSARIADGTKLNAWARRRRYRDRHGPPYLDLTVSNPTRLELPPGGDALDALRDPRAAAYRPHAAGLPGAREAVARDLRRHGARVAAEHVLLTSSTSEAYALLFKLLCAPGEAVLLPTPGYPLFEHLAALEAVRPVSYELRPEDGWSLDLPALRAGLPADARALVLVSPHNPTGWRLPESQRRALVELAAEHELAVIADEVFVEFTRAAGGPAAQQPAGAILAARAEHGLWFTLGGLSKSAGLPQMKVSWIVAGGEPSAREGALARLETAADMFLSVSSPAQLALSTWLESAGAFRQAVSARLDTNRRALGRALAPYPECELMPSQGGWSAVLRLPATRSDESDALALLDRHDILVQPGYLFDLNRGVYLVLSLLVQPDVLHAALPGLAAHLELR